MKRGEIYYIHLGRIEEVGSEQRGAGRPAVIVSNDICNETSTVVEVVYLTTQDKPDMPTHVTVRSTGRASTVLCEQINSVSKMRIGDYVATCTEDEMQRIDMALMSSLGLDYPDSLYDHEVDDADMHNDYYECESEEEELVTSADITRLETERDTYKALYESLLEKLIAR